MNQKLIQEFEKSQLKGHVEHVREGDTVRVSKVIVEGKKKRTQRYEGSVIKVQSNLSKRTIYVRKIVDNIGVEKSFLLNSPLVDVEVLSRGVVRRSRLFYLRDRLGSKARRIKKKEAKVSH